MTFTVEKRGDTDYRLISPDGNEIAKYDERPEIPNGIVDDVVGHLGLSTPASDAIRFVLEADWDYQDKSG